MRRVSIGVAGMVFGLFLCLQHATAKAQERDDTSPAELANQICDAFAMYSMTNLGPIHEAFELVLLDHLGITSETPGYRGIIRDYWNKNHQDMICTYDLPGLKSPQHILKRVIDMRSTPSFFFDYFLADRKVNINAVEQTSDGPETLVDFIDKVLAHPEPRHEYHLEEIATLRAFLVKSMDGKRAAELQQ